MSKEFAFKIVRKYFWREDMSDPVLNTLTLALMKLSKNNFYKEAVTELESEFLNEDVLSLDLIENIDKRINWI